MSKQVRAFDVANPGSVDLKGCVTVSVEIYGHGGVPVQPTHEW